MVDRFHSSASGLQGVLGMVRKGVQSSILLSCMRDAGKGVTFVIIVFEVIALLFEVRLFWPNLREIDWLSLPLRPLWLLLRVWWILPASAAAGVGVGFWAESLRRSS